MSERDPDHEPDTWSPSKHRLSPACRKWNERVRSHAGDGVCYSCVVEHHG